MILRVIIPKKCKSLLKLKSLILAEQVYKVVPRVAMRTTIAKQGVILPLL